MTYPFRLLGLSGSLRRASNSTAVLRAFQDALAPRAALKIFPLHAMPLYNEDDDGEQAPESSDSMIMISPEYNHGMSGVLKNALDWASRPYGRSALGGKPVLTMTASPAFTGGVRAQHQMNETLVSIPARLVHRPQIVIGRVHEKVRDGRLVDEAALRFALVSMISSTRSGQRGCYERQLPDHGHAARGELAETMTRRPRRNHTPAFKAMVAIAAIKSR